MFHKSLCLGKKVALHFVSRTLKILRNDVILLRCVPSFVIINFKFGELAIRFLNPLGLTSLNLRIFLPSGNEENPYAFQC